MMKLYSGTIDPFSHSCRFVLFEKDINCQVVDVDMHSSPEDLKLINPYSTVPVLVHRDLVLSEAKIINEYLDERYPYPPLMSSDPSVRARIRMFMYRFDKELFCHIDAIINGQPKMADMARQALKDNLIQLSGTFSKHKFMLGDELSMLDVAIVPLLWRLDHYGIKLGNDAEPLLKYADRLFLRPAFIAATTPAEKAMRKK